MSEVASETQIITLDAMLSQAQETGVTPNLTDLAGLPGSKEAAMALLGMALSDPGIVWGKFLPSLVESHKKDSEFLMEAYRAVRLPSHRELISKATGFPGRTHPMEVAALMLGVENWGEIYSLKEKGGDSETYSKRLESSAVARTWDWVMQIEQESRTLLADDYTYLMPPVIYLNLHPRLKTVIEGACIAAKALDEAQERVFTWKAGVESGTLTPEQLLLAQSDKTAAIEAREDMEEMERLLAGEVAGARKWALGELAQRKEEILVGKIAEAEIDLLLLVTGAVAAVGAGGPGGKRAARAAAELLRVAPTASSDLLKSYFQSLNPEDISELRTVLAASSKDDAHQFLEIGKQWPGQLAGLLTDWRKVAAGVSDSQLLDILAGIVPSADPEKRRGRLIIRTVSAAALTGDEEMKRLAMLSKELVREMETKNYGGVPVTAMTEERFKAALAEQAERVKAREKAMEEKLAKLDAQRKMAAVEEEFDWAYNKPRKYVRHKKTKYNWGGYSTGSSGRKDPLKEGPEQSWLLGGDRRAAVTIVGQFLDACPALDIASICALVQLLEFEGETSRLAEAVEAVLDAFPGIGLGELTLSLRLFFDEGLFESGEQAAVWFSKFKAANKKADLLLVYSVFSMRFTDKSNGREVKLDKDMPALPYSGGLGWGGSKRAAKIREGVAELEQQVSGDLEVWLEKNGGHELPGELRGKRAALSGPGASPAAVRRVDALKAAYGEAVGDFQTYFKMPQLLSASFEPADTFLTELVKFQKFVEIGASRAVLDATALACEEAWKRAVALAKEDAMWGLDPAIWDKLGRANKSYTLAKKTKNPHESRESYNKAVELVSDAERMLGGTAKFKAKLAITATAPSLESIAPDLEAAPVATGPSF